MRIVRPRSGLTVVLEWADGCPRRGRMVCPRRGLMVRSSRGRIFRPRRGRMVHPINGLMVRPRIGLMVRLCRADGWSSQKDDVSSSQRTDDRPR